MPDKEHPVYRKVGEVFDEECYPDYPVFFKNDKFYFYDETWVNFYGPYNSLEEADIALSRYNEGGYEIL